MEIIVNNLISNESKCMHECGLLLIRIYLAQAIYAKHGSTHALSLNNEGSI